MNDIPQNSNTPTSWMCPEGHFYERSLAAVCSCPECRRSWGPETVISELQQRAEDGKSMAPTVIYKEDSGLYLAMKKVFGSYDAGMKAAGLKSERKRISVHSKDTVIEALRERSLAGKPMNAGSLQKDSYGLYHAYKVLFGSYDAGMKAAGLKSDRRQRSFPPWSKESVVEAVLRRELKGLPLNAGSLKGTHQSLLRAAKKFFGSWDVALEAAGIDPKEVRLRTA
jgi:hypothetical protein